MALKYYAPPRLLFRIHYSVAFRCISWLTERLSILTSERNRSARLSAHAHFAFFEKRGLHNRMQLTGKHD